jgi:hypothetical protein
MAAPLQLAWGSRLALVWALTPLSAYEGQNSFRRGRGEVNTHRLPLVQSAQNCLLTISPNGATLLRMNGLPLFPKKGGKKSP